MAKTKPKVDHKYNKKLIVWAVVALIIGVLIGLIFTNLATTGKATGALKTTSDGTLTKSTGTAIPITPTAIPTADDRRDLTINTLNVNNIRNRLSALSINSTQSIDLNATGINMFSGIGFWLSGLTLKLSAGDSKIKLQSQDNGNPSYTSISGDNVNIITHLFSLKQTGDYNNTEVLTYTGGPSWAENLTINAPIKFPNLNEVTSTPMIYHVGDSIGIGEYLISIMNIHDANGQFQVEMQLSNDVNGVVASDVFREGDNHLFSEFLPMNLEITDISSNSVSIIVVPTEISYYACIGADGTLYKNRSPCN